MQIYRNDGIKVWLLNAANIYFIPETQNFKFRNA